MSNNVEISSCNVQRTTVGKITKSIVNSECHAPQYFQLVSEHSKQCMPRSPRIIDGISI